MASSTPNTILLKANGGGDRTVEEAIVVTTAITPGDLIMFGASGQVTPSTTAADTDNPTMFAVENPNLDPTVATNPAIDTDYAVGAVARFIYPQRGDVVYGWLEDEGNVAKGDPLEASETDGCLQAFSTGRIHGFADEAVNNTGGSGPVRIRVRIA